MNPFSLFFLSFSISIFGHNPSFCQVPAEHLLDSTVLSSQLNSWKSEYGADKTVPIEYELAFYKAVSHYNDLKLTNIEFKYARIKTTLNARPTIGSLLFRKRNNRKYIIRINNRDSDSVILLTDVPFNAQVGLIGHELAHFSDYNRKSLGGVLNRLFAYSSKKGIEQYEKDIDQMTINAGLGWQLYDWSHYVLYRSNGSLSYKEYKRTVYLEPEEIFKYIENMSSLF